MKNKNAKSDTINLQFTKDNFFLLYDLVCAAIPDFATSKKHINIYKNLAYIAKIYKEDN